MSIVAVDSFKWNYFCAHNSDAWFWHTREWIDYTLAYKPSQQSQDLSFMVMDSNEVLAVVPLMLETKYIGIGEDNIGVKELSFGSGYTWSPAISDNLGFLKKNQVRDTIFRRIDEIAKEQGVVRSKFVICPLALPSHNHLLEQGYLNTSLTTQIVMTGGGIIFLGDNMTKGHRSAINKGLKELTTNVISNINVTPELYSEYPRLHELDAGKKTRPQITFDMQYEWIKQGKAIMVLALKQEKIVGISYVIVYKGKAYYASACSNPEYKDLPIGHVLNWATIEWLNKKRCSHYEVGWQQYSPQVYDLCSSKDISISKFKRGFGGYAVPLFRGEKYYSEKFFQQVWTERIEQYGKLITQ